MIAWILILTILPFDYHGGAAIAAARFTSQKACVDAGNDWLHLVNAEKETGKALARCYPELK